MLSKILLLYAHPSPSRSEVNQPLFQVAKQLPFVTAVDLYHEYPKLDIDIEREQQRLLDHDLIIFQFPFFWYSTPAILKEWQDLVLEYGFAYGSEGNALHGKRFMCAITTGGSEKAYRADGYNHFTIKELLQPLEQTANITGMKYLPPFALFGSRTAVEEGRLEAHKQCWQRTLTALYQQGYDLAGVQAQPTLNDAVDAQMLNPQED
ncbi:NAD(P)H-dependent oxidoreductase [Ferrimonas aestuarii]|uniref:Flavodoxin family protein n=1 Tax=Ferrimonas aestuarii TaxID=2569539 RepID=A0A4U1BQN4_9GAMM|nr:NAD(P)H-dependent oxidoreductase [Ferrimonas aestuarii]TKB56642.1 flavodoxin family protein [Ferrimonas aestuarii]